MKRIVCLAFVFCAATGVFLTGCCSGRDPKNKDASLPDGKESRPFSYRQALTEDQQKTARGHAAYMRGLYLKGLPGNHREEARACFLSALKCFPPEKSRKILAEALATLKTSGEQIAFRKEFEKVLWLYPEDIEWNLVYFSLLEKEDVAAATARRIDFLRSCLERTEISREELLRVGTALAEEKCFEDSLTAFRLVLVSDPANLAAVAGIAHSYMALKKYDENICFLRSRKELTAELHFLLVILLTRVKKDERAAYDSLKPLLQREKPEDISRSLSAGWAYAGDICGHLGKGEDVLKCFQRAWQGDRKNPVYCNAYGYMLADFKGDLAMAETLIVQALRADPSNVAYIDSLAWVYFREDKYALAAQTMDRLNVKSLTGIYADGEIALHAGMIYFAVEQWDKAVFYLKLASQSKRKEFSSEAKKILDSLK